MKLIYLILNITCFIALSNYKPLPAQTVDTNMDYATIDAPNYKLITIAENICDLLLQGLSPDEIMEIFEDNKIYPYDIKKLVTKISNLQNKQISKDSAINVVVNNKESEEFYARKNLLAKAKICYFILKGIAALVVLIIILYLLARFFPGLFGFILPRQNDKPKQMPPNQTNPEQVPPEQMTPEQVTPEQVPPEQMTLEEATSIQGSETESTKSEQSQASEVDPMESNGKKSQASKIQDYSACGCSQKNGGGPPIHRCVKDIYYEKLSAEIKQQLENAKNLGFEPTVIEFSDLETAKGSVEIYKFNKTIMEKLITYAKSIGLEPAEIPAGELHQE